MAEVKWIKITTDIFDDEKILLIESMPASDSIIVIWFKLLTLAGKQNNDGVFMMAGGARMPYTEEMLATIFRRDINIVRLALRTFEKFGMVEIIDNVITIPNWGKHQTLDAYEKKKKRDRERIARKRSEQRKLIGAAACESPDMSPDTSTDKSCDMSPDVAFSEEEGDIEGDRDKERESTGDSVPESAPPQKPARPVRHKYGEYANVLLTDEELEKLKADFHDWEERIERLSEYIASSGKRYKSHYATIRSWAKKDAQAHPVIRRERQSYQKPSKAQEMDEFYNMAASWAEEGDENR